MRPAPSAGLTASKEDHMPAWAKLAWLNRARILAAAQALHWSRRTWLRLAGLGVIAVGAYLVATYGYPDRWNPATFSRSQWAQLIVNVTGFGILYVGLRSWWGRQDEVWDEVDQLREQVDELRVALAETREALLEYAPGEWVPEAAPDTVNAIPSARPSPPPVEAREPSTTAFASVRQAPTSDRERATVEREIGGRVFQFRG